MNNGQSIVLGSYVHGNSWLHKLDPRIKFLSIILLITTVFLIPISADLYRSILPVIIIFLLTLSILLSARLPIFKILRSFRQVVFLLLFTLILQVIQNKEGSFLFSIDFSVSTLALIFAPFFFIIYIFIKKYIHPYLLFITNLLKWALIISLFMIIIPTTFQTYTLSVHEDALLRVLFLVIRILSTLLISSLYTTTTSTIAMCFAIESLLSPLKKVKVPVSSIAMMFSLTFRFIPTIANELNLILRAQAARGLDFKEAKLFKKISQVIALLIPLFVIAFKKADDLAVAMISRGYNLDAKRTSIDVYKISIIDIFYSILIICVLVAGISLRFI